jgi:four helix bundle protein
MQSSNVYIRARKVVRELAPLLRVVQGRDRALADQLRRAAQSVVLNIAEARGSDAGNARARFATACGSAKEVRAALDVASDWGNDAIHSPPYLVEEVLVPFANDWKERLQPLRCLKRFLLNDESHE